MEFLEFETERHDLLAEGGEIVLVGLADLLDQAVDPEAFQQAGNLSTGLAFQATSQISALEAANVELATEKGLEQFLVVLVKEVEAAVGAAVFFQGARDLVELIGPRGIVVEGGEEFQVATIGREQ